MKKPMYANKEHEVVIRGFLKMNKEFVRDVANNDRWQNYIEVLNVVIDYHNNYSKGIREQNYWDWLMILPINVSVLTNGFLAAIETKRNRSVVRSYRIIINELVQDTVSRIEKLEPVNE
tara:strand:- start:1414 stop:1770 length:357 start_codon:yes stop_codon:yes gene_type:complete